MTSYVCPSTTLWTPEDEAEWHNRQVVEKPKRIVQCFGCGTEVLAEALTAYKAQDWYKEPWAWCSDACKQKYKGK